MESAIITKAKKKLSSDPQNLSLENERLFKIPEALFQLLDNNPEISLLSLANCKLNSLENSPNLPSLKNLNLSDNRVTDGDMKELLKYPNLTYLFLCGNRVAKVESVLALAPLQRLKVIDLEGCPVAEVEGLNEKLFKIFPNLKLVSGLNEKGDEESYKESDDEEEEDEEEVGEEDDFIEKEEQDETKPKSNEDDDDEDDEDEDEEEGDEEDDEDDEDEEADENHGEIKKDHENSLPQNQVPSKKVEDIDADSVDGEEEPFDKGHQIKRVNK